MGSARSEFHHRAAIGGFGNSRRLGRDHRLERDHRQQVRFRNLRFQQWRTHS
jgi:hypothetical protein